MASEPPAGPVNDLAERAARIRAVLTRWTTEPVTDEPDWSVEDIKPQQIEGDTTAPRK